MSYQKSVEELFNERFQDLMYVRMHDVKTLRRLVGNSFPDVPQQTLFCTFDAHGDPQCISDTYDSACSHAHMHGILVKLH